MSNLKPVSETDFDHFDEVSDAKKVIETALEKLSERERKVIYMRFGIGCRTDHTLEETAFAFPGATRERIRQIEAIKLSGKCGICHIPKIHLKNALQTFKSMQ